MQSLLIVILLIQYKAWKSQILSSTPKDEQKNVIKKLKEEQVRKLALLGEQYEQSIAEMLQKQSVSQSCVCDPKQVDCTKCIIQL